MVLLLSLLTVQSVVVVVPGRHGGGGGQAGDPGHPGAGRGVDGRVVTGYGSIVTGDERSVVDGGTPDPAPHAALMLHVGEWEVVDVAGHTGTGGVRMLLLET